MATEGIFAKRDTSGLTYDAVRPLIKWTYVWMFVGLIITSVIALATDAQAVFANNPGLLIGAIIAELVLVFTISLAINRLSPTVASIMFVVYAALNGFTLSLIV